MKLHMTGYRANAPRHAIRVPINQFTPDAREIFANWRFPPKNLTNSLNDFIDAARGEHEAIYVWMTNENS